MKLTLNEKIADGYNFNLSFEGSCDEFITTTRSLGIQDDIAEALIGKGKTVEPDKTLRKVDCREAETYTESVDSIVDGIADLITRAGLKDKAIEQHYMKTGEAPVLNNKGEPDVLTESRLMESNQEKLLQKKLVDKFEQEMLRRVKTTVTATGEKIAKDYHQLNLATIVAGDNYQQFVLSMADTGLNWQEQLINAALGLGEAGEVVGDIKKYFFHPNRDLFQNTPELTNRLIGELGDVLFYTAWIAELLNTTLGEVMQYNINKLTERHKQTGGFPMPSKQPGFTGSVFDFLH